MKIEIIDEDVSVIFKHESIITEILVVLMLKLLAIFWLHTVWIEREDTAKHNDKDGIIIEINLMPSNPSILVVSIL